MKIRQALGRIAILDPNIRVEESQSEDADIFKYIACVAVAIVFFIGIVLASTST